ncbi:hypothetical protein R1sor_006673 [Riccia sorocarpa]|uniref:Coenzyme Q-binding protein COQ10 START domain-containing protein n=1 Tax=Riccia sorocarpa TaxID=122646 RepID=A0ABD3HR41_9MARC
MRPSGQILRSVGRYLSVQRSSSVLTQPSITCESVARLPGRLKGNFLRQSCTLGSPGSGIGDELYIEKLRKLCQGDSALFAFQQRRGLLSVGDGDEENDRSRHHEEHRLIGYSPEQIYAVVAAVDLYEDFVPWCQKSRIIWHKPNEAMEAELEIGFKFFLERYISHIELKPPHLIKTSVSESTLFDYLINIWEFKPGPTPHSCNLHFLVEFQFRSPLYRKVANMFFNEVAQRLVASFENRCRTVYGPSLQVAEKGS